MPPRAAHNAVSTASERAGGEEPPYAPAAEFKRRLEYVKRSYLAARDVEAAYPSYNESLAILAKAVNPRAHRSNKARRPHPAIEVMVTARWRGRQRENGIDPATRKPTQAEIFDVCQELAAELKKVRGRPADPILTYHVHALMALVEEMSGQPARSARTKNSVYEPRMSSSGGSVIEIFFRSVDPSITTTALANIVREARSSGAIRGRKFRDFCPFYEGYIDPGSGLPQPGPGMKLESLDLAYPIYCS